MAEPYTPSAPYGTGTDDYRCFVLDPHLDHDAFITGLNIVPGQKKVVHHVILFQVPPSQVPPSRPRTAPRRARAGPASAARASATNEALDNAGWLGAWAPGGGEQVMAKDVGVPLAEGLARDHAGALQPARRHRARRQLGPAAARVRRASTSSRCAPCCCPHRSSCRAGPPTTRARCASGARRSRTPRSGSAATSGLAADYLHLLCGRVQPGPVQSCDREIHHAVTIRAAAGHMHLLGRSISIQVEPRHAPREDRARHPRVGLRQPGRQARQAGAPAARRHVRVTCRHDQSIRDLLPAFKGTQEKYVVWGEGTTDEMCLGLLLVTRS